MVQLHVRSKSRACLLLAGWVLFVLLGDGFAASSKKSPAADVSELAPELELPQGRKLFYRGAFDSELDARGKRGFWKKLLDVVAGAPLTHGFVRPYSVVTDSQHRVIVTDPGASGVHVFDFQRHTYKFLTHNHKHEVLQSPQCAAVDAQDNIYVTDSSTGKIFVFDSAGKFRRTIGSLPGGEGYFKRPTGIAIDTNAHLIYVTDTLRSKVFALDLDGKVVRVIGENGTAPGQFNYPTEVHIEGANLLVVDAMNFRIQKLDASGTALGTFGQEGDGDAHLFRPKGLATDTEGHYYVADAFHNSVQVFNSDGDLLYVFGGKGVGPGEFQLPEGLAIDRDDHIFVVDSFNRRVQVFQYVGPNKNQ